MKYAELRPKIIKDRIIRHREADKRKEAHLEKRDSLLRDLNRQYSFPEPDGSFGIGKRSHVNAEYVAKYDQIDDKYKKLYENEWKREVEIDNQALSIWEYLLFDNIIDREVEQHLLDIAEKHEDEGRHNFVRDRAFAEVRQWRKEYDVGGIMKRIAHEKSDLSYRVARCRKALSLSAFDFSAHKALFEFKSRYMRYLNEIFESLGV